VYVGIDIGGTNIKIATVSARGRVLARGIIDTLASRGPADAFDRIATAVASLSRGGDVRGVGVGCAGLIDTRGVVVSSPNLPAWENEPLARIARRALGVQVSVDNDATCAAWGEYISGGNRGRRHLVFITLGTGVGGGVISDGRVIRGAHNFGGELGHTTVDLDGPRCHCGNRGCLEAYVGSYGLLRLARAAMAERRSRYLTRWHEQGRKLTPALLAEAATRGDASARAVFRTAGEALGTGIASLVNVLNPEAVVIGGGVSASFDLFLPHVTRMVARRAFDAPAAGVRIERSSLGNDATAVGAAMFARDRERGRP
jgi:glucokinase